ncbi:MAG: TraR/DksA family transcriptional regulator [Candidatus Berkelbacteria bacterium]|nr:TraR/DksA family transcriptional regulator [Candidatus Berkelbacteria bacterium]
MKLDEKFIQKQKRLLEKEKEKLEKKMTELEKYPDYGRGDDDNAREYEDFENNLSLEVQLKTLDKKINTALKAIDKGTYGQCSVCKKEIESGRLKSVPYADVCVSCKKNSKR